MMGGRETDDGKIERGGSPIATGHPPCPAPVTNHTSATQNHKQHFGMYE